MMTRLKQFLRNNEGVAAIEFALVTLFILLPLLVGSIEMTRFAIVHQKLEKLTFSMADFITQGRNVSRADLQRYTNAATQIMSPFDFNGSIIFSSISKPLNPPANCKAQGTAAPMCVNWQYETVGGYPSNFGSEGGNAGAPDNYDVPVGQDIIVVEVYYNYLPLMNVSSQVLAAISRTAVGATKGGVLLYKTALYKPRQGTLTTLQ